MQGTVRESILGRLTFLLLLGLGSAAHAETETSPALPGEVALYIRHWPTRCTDLERAGKVDDARRCWWSAAEELDRYVDGHPRAQDMKDVQIDWQWRAARLALQSPEPPPAVAVENTAEVEVPTPKAKPAKRKAAVKPRKKKIVATPVASQPKKVDPQQGLLARTISWARKVPKKKTAPPDIPVTINYKPIYPH
jgi:hypothetical protein